MSQLEDDIGLLKAVREAHTELTIRLEDAERRYQTHPGNTRANAELGKARRLLKEASSRLYVALRLTDPNAPAPEKPQPTQSTKEFVVRFTSGPEVTVFAKELDEARARAARRAGRPVEEIENINYIPRSC